MVLETLNDERLVIGLGPREREVFEKHFYESLSPQEIAEYFDTTLNSVHKMISRISKKVEGDVSFTQSIGII